MTDEPNPVQLERRGGVALVTLNRPHVLNAMNTAMGVRMGEVMDEIAEDASVRVVVLTGAGERAFCAGGDLKERQGMTPEQWTRQHRIFERSHYKIRNLRKPIFAAVNGVAVGGGCEMAMSTDFIVAAEHARFGQPEVTRGIMPGAGGTQLLPRFLPRGLAFQLLMTGEMISAAEAHRWGLVNRVLAAGELLDEAMGLAERIAANSPGAVQQAKRSARMGLEQPLEAAIETEIECYQRMVDHPDRYEGVDAFNERRPPVFRDAY
ncbi:MAG TPA: enoyl-CoA hydratase/isomerase family protein [Candidatus Dormibacteraeota bacterium]|nr:enoyl-CoA hydratase/isomerase family protein [Candidatus Dormibacteraeota bacterium]